MCLQWILGFPAPHVDLEISLFLPLFKDCPLYQEAQNSAGKKKFQYILIKIYCINSIFFFSLHSVPHTALAIFSLDKYV